MPLSTVAHLWSRRDARDLEQLEHALEVHDLAGALLAIEGVASDIRHPCRTRLSRWSRAVASLEPSDDGPGAAAALRAVLSDEVNLRGIAADSRSLRHNHLSAVIQGRRGLPILVSSVWLIVARGAGLTADGISLPGHFIVRLGAAAPTFIDAADRGRPLSVADCRAKVEALGLPWSDAFLDPVDDTAIAARTLRNLVGDVERLGEGRLLYRTARLLAEIRPVSAAEQLRLAAVTEAIGLTPLAMHLYTEVMRRFSSTPEAYRARERLDHLRAHPPTLH